MSLDAMLCRLPGIFSEEELGDIRHGDTFKYEVMSFTKQSWLDQWMDAHTLNKKEFSEFWVISKDILLELLSFCKNLNTTTPELQTNYGLIYKTWIEDLIEELPELIESTNFDTETIVYYAD